MRLMNPQEVANIVFSNEAIPVRLKEKFMHSGINVLKQKTGIPPAATKCKYTMSVSESVIFLPFFFAV